MQRYHDTQPYLGSRTLSTPLAREFGRAISKARSILGEDLTPDTREVYCEILFLRRFRRWHPLYTEILRRADANNGYFNFPSHITDTTADELDLARFLPEL